MYIDPNVQYIPTKKGDAEWKLRSSKKAQEEAEMSDDELDEKRGTEEAKALAGVAGEDFWSAVRRGGEEPPQKKE